LLDDDSGDILTEAVYPTFVVHPHNEVFRQFADEEIEFSDNVFKEYLVQSSGHLEGIVLYKVSVVEFGQYLRLALLLHTYKLSVFTIFGTFAVVVADSLVMFVAVGLDAIREEASTASVSPIRLVGDECSEDLLDDVSHGCMLNRFNCLGSSSG
jgi:hypothetical protein